MCRTMPEDRAKARKGADHHQCIGKEKDRVFDEPAIDQKPVDAAICPMNSHLDTPLLDPCCHWR
jgi:hypothetical protein